LPGGKGEKLGKNFYGRGFDGGGAKKNKKHKIAEPKGKTQTRLPTVCLG